MIKYHFTLQCVKLDRKATDKETGQHLWNLGLQLTGLEHEFVPYQTEKDEAGVEPKIEAIGESTVKKRDKIKELGETKSKMSDDFGYQDEQLKELRTEVEELKARTDTELNQLREDMQGVKKFISIY